MGVKLQVCFEVDLPTGTKLCLEQQCQPMHNGIYKCILPKIAFVKQFPMLIPYLVRNGYMNGDYDFVLTVLPDGEKDEETVDQPMAQPAEM